MAKKKTKSTFIGIKATPEQAALLAKLQEQLNSGTKTEVLLKGLELLAQLSAEETSAVPEALLADRASGSQPATSLELAQLEAEAQQYRNLLQQTKNKTEGVMRQVIKQIAQTDEVLARYGGDSSELVQMLLDIQHENHWLPKEALVWFSQKLGVPLTQVYQIATFYKAFSLVPKGKHLISVCMGSACQVRGAPALLDRVIEVLKIAPGETSADMRFSLDTENCPGCCALAPLIVVDGIYYRNPSAKEIKQIMTACK